MAEKTSPSGRILPKEDRPPIQNIPVKKSFTITAEATALLLDIKAVEQTVGKDARKARLLTITARALLTKLAEASPAVKFLLEGKAERKT